MSRSNNLFTGSPAGRPAWSAASRGFPRLRREASAARRAPRGEPARRQTNGAFTLVELLITGVILGIIGVVIVSTLASGLKAYEKVRVYAGARKDILLSMEKLEMDLKNVPDFSGINFVGTKKEVSFAGLVNIKDAKGKPKVSLGRILYCLDGRGKSFVREEQPCSSGRVQKIKTGRGAVEPLASVERINLSYYCFNEENKTYEWRKSWGSEKEDGKAPEESMPPLGVKVEIGYKDGGKICDLKRTILIPTTMSRLKEKGVNES
ncbi:MAG: type II secretion system protein [Candidatus Omnitrophica bacterium]|nr:type II secretion system protein [Candidatus Omnitrophota bacterium]